MNPSNASPPARKRGHQTGAQQPPQVKGQNSSFADTHGAYSLRRRIESGVLDGRTKAAKAMKELRLALYAHVGGEPSMPEAILIERVVNKLPVVEAMEAYRLILYSQADGKEGEELMKAYESFLVFGLDTRYLQMCNSLRADLTTLGLKTPTRPEASMQEYLEQISDVTPK